jgi:hypothetical protein
LVQVLLLVCELEVLCEELGDLASGALHVAHGADDVRASDAAEREDEGARRSGCGLLGRVLEDWEVLVGCK